MNIKLNGPEKKPQKRTVHNRPIYAEAKWITGCLGLAKA